MLKIAYDCTLRRPACPLLQAALGCDRLAGHFDSEHWLTEPTPNMQVYQVTVEQLRELVILSGKVKQDDRRRIKTIKTTTETVSHDVQ